MYTIQPVINYIIAIAGVYIALKIGSKILKSLILIASAVFLIIAFTGVGSFS